MRVALIITSLDGGGAQRVVSTMANYWSAKDWNVTVVTFDDGRVGPAYRLRESVLHRPLGVARDSGGRRAAPMNGVRRVMALRREIKVQTPDVVVSFIDVTNVVTVLAAVGLGVPVVVSERIDPSRHRIGLFWRVLRPWCYRWAAGVVTQTTDALRFFSHGVRRRGRVIPNPVPAVGDGDPGVGSRNATIVGMGRLSRQKGFDLLLRAVAAIAGTQASWSLVIWGEGECRGELESLRDELGLRGRVSLPGWTAEPLEELRRSGIFVLSSRYEGFPNVLCEAMACGLPVVSFDCPSGPREIIRDGVDGILVPAEDCEALARALRRLLEDESERSRLGTRAIEVADRFGVHGVMSMWEDMLTKARDKRPRERSVRCVE